MGVDRFLGAAWASVHGPADPAALAAWTLELGFHGLQPAPAPRPLDWSAVWRARGTLPFRFAPMRLSPSHDANADHVVEAGLASSHEGDRESALAAVAGAVRQARALGCATVVLQPGIAHVSGEVPDTDLGGPGWAGSHDQAVALKARRDAVLDRALDRVCRSLHMVCKSFPDSRFALTLSRSALGLGEPGALAAIFEDLGRYRVEYWHDTAAAEARRVWLGEDPGSSLERFSNRLSGMILGDYAESRCGLPPGSGGVDYPLLSAYRQPSVRGFPVVIELDPGVESGEIAGAHAFLDKIGL